MMTGTTAAGTVSRSSLQKSCPGMLNQSIDVLIQSSINRYNNQPINQSTSQVLSCISGIQQRDPTDQQIDDTDTGCLLAATTGMLQSCLKTTVLLVLHKGATIQLLLAC